MTSREAASWLAVAGYTWLVVFGVYVALVEILAGPSVAAGLIAGAVALVTLDAGYIIGESLRAKRPFQLWLPAVAPLLGAISGLVVVLSGRPLSGILLVLPALAVLAVLFYRDAAAWRQVAGEIGRGRRSLQPEPAPLPAPIARQVRLTPSERAARFTAEVFALDEAQLDVLTEAWEAIDNDARSAAWNAARPYLTAMDRKDLLTEVREELKRWTAGEGHGEGAPTQEIETRLRHRGNRALLDAAAGIIAQDRIAKHDFDILYAPFRSALTGEPVKIARRSPRSADGVAASGRASRSRRKTAAESGEETTAPQPGEPQQPVAATDR